MVYDLADEYVDGAVAVEVTEAKVSSDTEAFGVDFFQSTGFGLAVWSFFSSSMKASQPKISMQTNHYYSSTIPTKSNQQEN